jgi:beta-mannosidase
VRWSLETLDGQVLDAAVLPVAAAPLATTPVAALDLSVQVHADNRRNLIFVAELWEGGRWISQQMATFVPNKHLELVDPGLTVSVTQPAPDQMQVELRAQTLARFVEVSCDGLDTIFSDNYVDVRTGRPVVLTAPVPAGTTLEQLQKALRVQSLYRAYEASLSFTSSAADPAHPAARPPAN